MAKPVTASVPGWKGPWNTEKDGRVDGTEAPPVREWTRYLVFDKNGRIYVRDEDLAREIQGIMNAWGRLVIYRDKFAEEGGQVQSIPDAGPRRMLRAKQDTRTTQAIAAGDEPGGNLVNTVCSCGPG